MRCTRWCGAPRPMPSSRGASFDEVLELAGDGIVTGRGRRAAYLHRDRVHREAPRAARRAAGRTHLGWRDPGSGGLPRRGRPGRHFHRHASTKIGRSRAWRATCSCSAPRPGGYAASSPARCGSSTPRAHDPRSRSGSAKRRREPASSAPKSASCAARDRRAAGPGRSASARRRLLEAEAGLSRGGRATAWSPIWPRLTRRSASCRRKKTS